MNLECIHRFCIASADGFSKKKKKSKSKIVLSRTVRQTQKIVENRTFRRVFRYRNVGSVFRSSFDNKSTARGSSNIKKRFSRGFSFVIIVTDMR